VDFPQIQYKSTKVDPSEAAAAIASISSAAKASVDEELNKQQLQTLPSSSLVAPVVVEPNSSPKVDPNVAYVEALTNFAMEQAAAANSAAAAATAAIQAVNFYRQLQQMEGRSSTFVGSTSKLHCLDFFRSNK
jgi:antirestriction protein ArdC